MARQKGSKNRSTLVSEMVALGRRPEEFLGWDHLSIKNEHESMMAAAPPKPPAPTEQSIVDGEYAKQVVADTRRRFQMMVEYYVPDEDEQAEAGTGELALVPERIQEYLRKVFFAKNNDEAKLIRKRSLDKLHTHLLKLWSDRYISGPNTPDLIEKRAKKKDSLAKMLEKKGDLAAAEKQKAMAEAIRATPPHAVQGQPWLNGLN